MTRNSESLRGKITYQQAAVHLRIIELLLKLEETEQLVDSPRLSEALQNAQGILFDLLLAAGKADNERLIIAIKNRLALSPFALFGNPADKIAIQVPTAADVDPELCRRIGEVIIQGLPPERPSLQHVIMTIRLDSNGILQVSATDAEAEAAAAVAAVWPTSVAQVTGVRSTAEDETERAATETDEAQTSDTYSQDEHTDRQTPRHSGCPHVPQCPDASSPDREAAHVIVSHPEQGWSLLCNGIVIFEDTGEVLPDGASIAPHRPTDLAFDRPEREHTSGTRWRDSS